MLQQITHQGFIHFVNRFSNQEFRTEVRKLYKSRSIWD